MRLAFVLALGTVCVHAFKIVVDVNQLNATEAAAAAMLKCDGIWFTSVNSPAGIDWRTVVTDIGGNSFAISEDIHCCGPPICPTSQCFPPATTYHDALAAGCSVFGSFVYVSRTRGLTHTQEAR
jgi:hypothetical protein